MKILAIVPLLLFVQASFFDMQGTITDVLTPTSLKIDSTVVDLKDIDTSGLNATQYWILMQILDDWLIGKDVLVKENYVYFDLNGSYNSRSINEMIQKEINDLRDNYLYYVDSEYNYISEATIYRSSAF